MTKLFIWNSLKFMTYKIKTIALNRGSNSVLETAPIKREFYCGHKSCIFSCF